MLRRLDIDQKQKCFLRISGMKSQAFDHSLHRLHHLLKLHASKLDTGLQKDSFCRISHRTWNLIQSTHCKRCRLVYTRPYRYSFHLHIARFRAACRILHRIWFHLEIQLHIRGISPLWKDSAVHRIPDKT